VIPLEAVRRIASLEVAIFLGALLALTIIKLLTGAINTRHLLANKEATGTRGFSATRAQVLVFTLAAALIYLLEAAEAAPRHQLPEVPNEMLALVGASQLIYLGGKAYSRDLLQALRTLLFGGLR
jgi:hypothetical protein